MIKATSVATDDGLEVTTTLKGTGQTLITEASSVLTEITKSARRHVPGIDPEAVCAIIVGLAVSHIEKFDKEMFLRLLAKGSREEDKEEKQNEAVDADA